RPRPVQRIDPAARRHGVFLPRRGGAGAVAAAQCRRFAGRRPRHQSGRGRGVHLNAAAAQLAPALRRNELAQFALRSPEIITALREAIATSEPRRATYLDQVPVDRWMELSITPVPVPTLFGGTERCMLMTFHDLTPLRRVEEMRADFVANASHELRTPLAALSGFIDTLQGP